MDSSWIERSFVKIPRIFPAGEKFFYDGSVHNRPITDRALPWSMKNILIRHWFQADENKETARNARTREFFAERKDAIKTFDDYFRFCRLCMSLGKFDEINTVWEKGYKLYQELELWDKNRFQGYLLFICYARMMLKDLHSWKKYCDEYVELFGEELDSALCLFTYHYAAGEFKEALRYTEDFIRISDTILDKPFKTRTTFGYKPEIMLKRNFITYAFNKGIIK